MDIGNYILIGLAVALVLLALILILRPTFRTVILLAIKERPHRRMLQMKEKGDVKGLIEALKNRDCEVRYWAAGALGKLGDASAVDPLINQIKGIEKRATDPAADKGWIARLKVNASAAVAWALGRLSDKHSDEALAAAATALGQIGDPRAVDPLIETLQKDGTADFKAAVATALGQIGNPRAVNPLVEALKNDVIVRFDMNARTAFAIALCQIGSILEGEDEKTEALRCRIEAKDALTYLGLKPPFDENGIPNLATKQAKGTILTSSDTDLLPPIFNQVVSYFGDSAASPQIRVQVLEALVHVIVHAIAESAVRQRLLTGIQAKNSVGFTTYDRLSGNDLSRAQLIERMQRLVPLPEAILEIALLLVESQIDLRLVPNKDELIDLRSAPDRHQVEVGGVTFSLADPAQYDTSSWCQNILSATLHGILEDRSTVWSRLSRHRPERIRILVEGLQLSATLRPAVRYKIAAQENLIDGLVDEGDDPGICVLHISDLHLVADITEQGRRKIRPFFTATHNGNTARALAQTVMRLQPKYTIVLATGDLTTDGDQRSFETAKHFIEDSAVYGDNPGRIATFGLSAGIGKHILLPGNHDRYGNNPLPGQLPSMLFETALDTSPTYPYVIGYRPFKRSDDKDSLTLLFFVFDSNLPKYPKPTDVVGRIEAVAEGEVTTEDIVKANYLAKWITEKEKVYDISRQRPIEFNPQNTIRIAVLHHHPLLSNSIQAWIKKDRNRLQKTLDEPKIIEESLKELRNAEAFLQACLDIGIQLVLFGHHHIPYHRIIARSKDGKQNGEPEKVQTPFGIRSAFIHAFCCPSALEYTAAKNGFLVFDFPDERTASVCHYSYEPKRDKLDIVLFERDKPDNKKPLDENELLDVINELIDNEPQPRKIDLCNLNMNDKGIYTLPTINSQLLAALATSPIGR